MTRKRDSAFETIRLISIKDFDILVPAQGFGFSFPFGFVYGSASES